MPDVIHRGMEDVRMNEMNHRVSQALIEMAVENCLIQLVPVYPLSIVTDTAQQPYVHHNNAIYDFL